MIELILKPSYINLLLPNKKYRKKIRMKLTIWGAARQVTGSMHLLELQNGFKILVDCGLSYENGKEGPSDYFPFNCSEIDLVILTHAHVDHSGNLPTLVKNGYQGQIICTPATAQLTAILLNDTANILLSKMNTKRKNGRRRERNRPPIYLHKHVMDALERVVDWPADKNFKVDEHLSFTFVRAGHLLGAIAVVFTVIESGIEKKIGFTGDLGRKNYPTLKDPVPLIDLDYLVSESTYGGRFHSREKTIEEVLTEVINETCIDSPGRLIIPAFSIGRTQALIFLLDKLHKEGKIGNVPIYIDSPMAMQATSVYRRFSSELSDDAGLLYNEKVAIFDQPYLNFVENMAESKTLNKYSEPAVLVSSAGMLEGGRIQDHLYHNIQNYYCTLLFVGYCARGTLGRKLLDGAKTVRINDRDLHVFATIKRTDQLSGHADHSDLIEYLSHANSERLKKVFLVHGEIDSMENLQNDLIANKFEQVILPKAGEVFEL